MQLSFGQTYNLFTTILISIMFEAIPFLLFGTLLSSIIEVFVSEKFFERFIPKNRFLALLPACLIGIVFPVCECAIIPVAARLLKKGVPLSFTTAFVLAVPIINIPVMLSTYYAFSGQLHIVILRIVCGFPIAYIMGLVVSFIRDKKEILLPDALPLESCGCREHNHTQGEGHRHECGGAVENQDNDAPGKEAGESKHHHSSSDKIIRKILSVLRHTTTEFFETGKYLLIGALVTSLFQSVLPRSILAGIGGNMIVSTIFMAFFAYMLSICSQTDAFIARSFLGQFPQGAIVGFMVVGAMIDLKNTAMLTRVIKKKYILVFIIAISTCGFIASMAINLIWGV